ncbi:hypothetical protein E2562_021071 [Oryza meyeriana var. granulata]|uniref:Uncharacterized protein n=1 Tax=Oryza meyeriana var. granulata TaxID=110450 RepID=A0A6G1BNQ8_9ORYZ|nr:hypothetical protein E2562_021071 [Oryza meyeriana var. granulata]
MVNTMAQTEPSGTVPAEEEGPTQVEVDGGTHAVAADPSHLERLFQIGNGLPPKVEEAIVQVLQRARGQVAQNLDRFITATKAWFNTKLAPHSFVPGDMVLRRAHKPEKLQNK